MLLESPEIRLTENPDRILMVVDGLSPARARGIANAAVREARRKMPKATGDSAKRLQPLYGKGFFGIYFPDSYTFFQDHGIRPFTMKSLAGKTIPMWISDPTGVMRASNPKAKVKIDAAGKVKVLIFRKVAPMGARKEKWLTDKKTGTRTLVSDTPMSYPGAPGRIGTRQTGSPYTSKGKIAGAIARGNSGVRWRHPGIAPRLFLNNALTLAAQWDGILPVRVYYTDRSQKVASLS